MQTGDDDEDDDDEDNILQLPTETGFHDIYSTSPVGETEIGVQTDNSDIGLEMTSSRSQPDLTRLQYDLDLDIFSSRLQDGGAVARQHYTEVTSLGSDHDTTSSKSQEDVIREQFGEVIHSTAATETRFPSMSPADILVPHSADVLLRSPPPSDHPGSKVKGHSHKDKSPRSTIAVRAMELETRKKYPELSAGLTSSALEVDLDLTESKRPRSLREKLFGSNSKGRFKTASHGKHVLMAPVSY